MKKSDMIQIMKSARNHALANNILHHKIDEYVLFKMMEAGMMPPFSQYEIVIPEGMYLTEDIRDEPMYEWDPED